MIVDLRDGVRDLKKENRELTAMVGDGAARLDEHRAEAMRLKNLLAEKDAANDEMKTRVAELVHERFVLRLVILGCVMALLVLLFSKRIPYVCNG